MVDDSLLDSAQMIFECLSGPGAPYTLPQLASVAKRVITADVPDRRRVKAQLDHLERIGVIRETEAGYEIA